ncbi:hypothetical protein [Pseudomonas sp. 313]|uniref:hypothetical protein n=1 Tax=Pseudomonas sp. 313 TaxID=1234594 RepID=UPI0012F79EE6|nr:hypothetical protein [Pseudomonas sp. 313]
MNCSIHLEKTNSRKAQFFSCAYAESYENIATYGLVITARCDAAQNKAPIYNFVPVVRLTDWILRDGAEIILQREMQDLLNRKKSILRQANISESLLDSKTTDEILQLQLIPMAAVDKKIAVKAKEYKEFSNREVRIKKALDLWDNEILTEEIKLSRKTLDQVIQELASNRLVGHYLLREMPSLYNDKNGDYVALLREIHHIKKSYSKKNHYWISERTYSNPKHTRR